MAPRRLIIAMVLLLAFSTALAVLVPQPQTPEGTGSGSETTDPSQGSQVEPKIESKPKPKPPEAEPDRPRKPAPGVVEATVINGDPARKIRVRPGDRLILEVRSPRTALVELAGTGLIDTAGPYDPAVFDVLAGSRGERFLARDLDTDRRIALVVVR